MSRLYDGVNVRLLSDQQLQEEYDLINNHRYDPFYQDKMGYLWFRARDIYYELERRSIQTEPPVSFVNTPKHHFGYWDPPVGEQQKARIRAQMTMMDDHTKYGRPINEHHRRQLDRLF